MGMPVIFPENGIDELMMSGNNEGALDFIAEMSHRSTTYHDISLVSHPAGEVAVSRLQIPGTQLDIGDRSCRLCHVTDDLADTALNARAEVAVGSAFSSNGKSSALRSSTAKKYISAKSGFSRY